MDADLKPDPSVPLSAIRALVQQWRATYAASVRLAEAGMSNDLFRSEVKKQCADELAALCPAPPEDQP